MSGIHSFTSYGSRPGMEKHRGGNSGVYYDKEGRVYYKGQDENENTPSQSQTLDRYGNDRGRHDNGFQNGDARREYRTQPRPMTREVSDFDRNDSRHYGEDEEHLNEIPKGYKVVNEYIKNPDASKRYNDRSNDRYRSMDRSRNGDHSDRYRTGDRSILSDRYRTGDRSVSSDRYRSENHRYENRNQDRFEALSLGGYSNKGRPLPTIPREERRNKKEWHEMNGVSSDLPQNYKDKAYLVEQDNANQQDKKCYYVPFICAGILLIICGVMNLLFCGEFQYYFRFWAGILVLETGLFGAVHKGNYGSGWKSLLFMLSCAVSAIASLVGFAFLTRDLVPETIKVSAAHNFSEYARESVPKSTYSDVDSDDVTAVVCFSFDWVTIGVLLVCFTTLSVALQVFDKYWTHNFYFTQVVEPFCQPALFNPFGQVQISELVVMLGIVTVYACSDSDYMDYWSPVWAGGISILGGILSVAAMKRYDITFLSILALFTEIVAVLSSIAAVVLCVLGLVKNISATDKKQSSLEEDISVTSATLYAVTISITLINIFFGIAQMVRLVSYVCAPAYTRKRLSQRYLDSPNRIGNRSGYDRDYLEKHNGHRSHGFGNHSNGYGISSGRDGNHSTGFHSDNLGNRSGHFDNYSERSFNDTGYPHQSGSAFRGDFTTRHSQHGYSQHSYDNNRGYQEDGTIDRLYAQRNDRNTRY